MNETVRTLIEDTLRERLGHIEVKKEQLEHAETAVKTIRRDLTKLEEQAEALREALR